MQRTLGMLGNTGSLLLIFLVGCSPTSFGNRDQDPPGSSKKEDVASRCRDMEFDETYASPYQLLDASGQVIVKIIPAALSSKTKASHLGSKRGRIIARVHNRGTGAWPKMALVGGSTSCWYVWEDKDGQLRSKFVPMTGIGDEMVDANFDIQYHAADHPRDEAAWNRPYLTGMAVADSLLPPPSPDSTTMAFLGGNTGWTTCLINGCCRSRQ